MRPFFKRVSDYPIFGEIPTWPLVAKNDLGWYATYLEDLRVIVEAVWITPRPVRAPQAALQWTPFKRYGVVTPGRFVVRAIRTRAGFDAKRWSDEWPGYRSQIAFWPHIEIIDRITSPKELNRFLFRLDDVVADRLMEETL